MKNISGNRWFTFIALALLIANIASLVFLWRQGRPGRHEFPVSPPGGQAFEYISHELKFDSAQLEAYQLLRVAHRSVQEPLQDSIRMSKDNLFALLSISKVSDSMIRMKANQIGELEAKLNQNTFQHFTKLRAICSDEQKNKFDSIIQDVLKRIGNQRAQGPPPDKGFGPPDREKRPPPPGGPEDDRIPPPPKRGDPRPME
ncbi:MAG: hypothetical protein D4R55_01975 [Chitinophagaceae bacterium]|nr:hypothetical protein [Sphingobacteriales bacterium]TSA42742.1 MAG: hypothetical protein D4R55_01975 [Chitinophagaceae bacterium]